MAKAKSPAVAPRAKFLPELPIVNAPPSDAGDEASKDAEPQTEDPAPQKPLAAEAPRKTVRARIVLDSPEDAAVADDQHAEQPTEEEVVTVLTPKRYRLTLDNGTVVEYQAGNPTMPRSHAEHFYSKANGVTIKE